MVMHARKHPRLNDGYYDRHASPKERNDRVPRTYDRSSLDRDDYRISPVDKHSSPKQSRKLPYIGNIHPDRYTRGYGRDGRRGDLDRRQEYSSRRESDYSRTDRPRSNHYPDARGSSNREYRRESYSTSESTRHTNNNHTGTSQRYDTSTSQSQRHDTSTSQSRHDTSTSQSRHDTSTSQSRHDTGTSQRQDAATSQRHDTATSQRHDTGTSQRHDTGTSQSQRHEKESRDTRDTTTINQPNNQTTTSSTTNPSNNERQPVRTYGDWSEYVSNSSGKSYYYNHQTEVSQWVKPDDWINDDKNKTENGENSRLKSDVKTRDRKQKPGGDKKENRRGSISSNSESSNRHKHNSSHGSDNDMDISPDASPRINSTNSPRTNSSSKSQHLSQLSTKQDSSSRSQLTTRQDGSSRSQLPIRQDSSSRSQLTIRQDSSSRSQLPIRQDGSSRSQLPIRQDSSSRSQLTARDNSSRSQPDSSARERNENSQSENKSNVSSMMLVKPRRSLNSGRTPKPKSKPVKVLPRINKKHAVKCTCKHRRGKSHQTKRDMYSPSPRALQTLQTLKEVLNRKTLNTSSQEEEGSPLSPHSTPTQHDTQSELKTRSERCESSRTQENSYKTSESSQRQHTETSSQNNDTQHLHSNNDGGSKKEEGNTSTPFYQPIVLPPSLINHYDPNLLGHISGWASQLIEQKAQEVCNESLLITAHHCGQISAELKQNRSLVRINEIQSTLLESRIDFLRKQMNELENDNSTITKAKPPT